MNNLLSLPEIIETAFNRAIESPSISRWHSVSIMAGCAAVRMALEGHHFLAASLEGVADEAKRRQFEMQPQRIAA